VNGSTPMRWVGPAVLALLACVATPVMATQPARLLDGFEEAGAWRVVVSNQVTARLRPTEGAQGKALCLDYDFNGVSGYAGLQRDLDIEYPENYRFDFLLRGDSPRNDLQFKLVDASGDNVWWVNRTGYDFPANWTPVSYRRRHIDKAWGPDPERVLRRSARLEFTVYNAAGGHGSVCFDTLQLTALPAQDESPLDAQATYHDGPVPRLLLDLGKRREFGGLRLQWQPGRHAAVYRVSLSDDARSWQGVREVRHGNGGVDHLALPESEARYLAIDLLSGSSGAAVPLQVQVQPLAYAATANDFVRSVAREAPRGWFPRGFSGEQPYWTLVGIDGGRDQALLGEDGAVEFGRGGISVAPVVQVEGGQPVTWADVETAQTLQEGYLPIPSATWRHRNFGLRITAYAQGEREHARTWVRYRLENPGPVAREYVLALLVQPFQVNPPSQFLNTRGGVSPIRRLRLADGMAWVNDGQAVFHYLQPPEAVFTTAFDQGMAIERWAAGDLAVGRMAAHGQSASVEDDTGLASGALFYRMRLDAGEAREVVLQAPLGAPVAAPESGKAQADAAQQAVAAQWRERLDAVRLELPPAGQAVADALRTATAHMLISRVGPRLQPGTRSYSRSWIRDGAMISEGLLRMGRADAVREYVEWYAPYQFRDGMVPCCVDDRGSDPVPENDSHGELIFNIAEYWRYTGDTDFLRRMWPHVRAAFDYMERLSLSERTEANRALNPAFFGMMPASISHEGYSAKPMHSYWDNFWALRGYKDAVEVAQALGEGEEAQRFAAARDRFRADLDASLQAAARLHGIDYLPGAAELGDFDPTSTTIALAPGGEQGRLPQALLRNTFERYWREFVQRRDGLREWKDYTPYEWRNVGAFVRLGWRARAGEALRFFMADRAPAGWNQWGEVVSRTPRTPFFLGDLPHAWVASDFLRSALDMFAYVREADDAVVLAAGVPPEWLHSGVAVRGLRTVHGTLSYRLHREGDTLRLEIDAGSALPAGGAVLPWPFAGAPGRPEASVPVRVQGGEVHVARAPAQVVIPIGR